MTAPLPPLPTQEQVTRRLIWLNSELDPAKEDLRRAMEEHAKKVKRATLIEAEAWATAEGTQDAKKWLARAAAADAQYEVGIALAAVKAADAHLWNLKEQIGSTQTLAANVRAEMAVLGVVA
jgi:hypothetical protein